MIRKDTRDKSNQASRPLMIKDLRSLRVLLLQPDNAEGKELWEHLSRIGCNVQSFWPPPLETPPNVDVVFLFMRSLVEGEIDFNWNADNPPAVLIAIVDYENPTIVEKILRLKAQAVIGLPLRPFGVLANVLLSVNNQRREQRIRVRVERLETKIRAFRDIDKAKAILMKTHKKIPTIPNVSKLCITLENRMKQILLEMKSLGVLNDICTKFHENTNSQYVRGL